MAAPPWSKAQTHEQFFVLITGANSGIGFGTAERIIDEFLASRSLSSHLILIPTTRDLRKSRETVESLRTHLHKTATTSKALAARAGPSYKPQDTIDRVHLLSVQLDLLDLRSPYAVARQLVHGTVSDPTDADNTQYKVPRLDAVILNAGIGGFKGVDWFKLAWRFLTRGIVYMCCFPDYKIAIPGLLSPQKPAHPDEPAPPPVGQVFCANVLGHYILTHELMPLLSRDAATDGDLPAGRIAWTSSIEPVSESLDLADFQGIRSLDPYSSSKRITDLLALTCRLPAAQPHAAGFFQVSADAADDDSSPETNTKTKRGPKATGPGPRKTPPSMLVTHPGIVHSTFFPVPGFLVSLYWLALLLARWCGSPCFPVDRYRGAKASVWARAAGRRRARRARRLRHQVGVRRRRPRPHLRQEDRGRGLGLGGPRRGRRGPAQGPGRRRAAQAARPPPHRRRADEGGARGL
ncbi:3-ketosteroid reductase [Verticillium alfalfae VaMs.102]|uniref:3-ketosteroid reductase n=1 Tax=Verticillium alfalfae (strain VaMs.102 / ATCC MYA-4576 / FGSC 10136) TaxID=526221 RepID=C9ST23_VERA1|nr:3-ketosteroid reductase [Verticillium alfalfae VaMs.102]EEY21938.1 3-ketosteroid reductase [Verticillium alfalfae VaMs.102]